MTKSYAFANTLPGSLSRYCKCSSFGEVNGWWFDTQRFSSLSNENAGKSTTQADFEVLLKRIDQVEPAGQLDAQRAERLADRVFCVGDEEQQVASLRGKSLAQRRLDSPLAGTSRSAN